MSQQDRERVRRMLAGDEQAFEECFEATFPGLYRFALVRLNHDEDAAEEVAQAALCKAMRKLGTYRGEAALFTWLCTFCRHEISAWYRARSGREPIDLIEDSLEVRGALESLGATFEEPSGAAERAELSRLVQVALDHLPPHYAHALEWKYLEDRPVEEIATRLRITAKAAESLLTRARAAFREAFTTLTRSRALESSS